MTTINYFRIACSIFAIAMCWHLHNSDVNTLDTFKDSS